MNDALKTLETVATDAIETIWSDFAKQGKETAVFAPFSKYPRAGGWLARRMSLSEEYITRKLGAMLAGWVHDREQLNLLSDMLERERKVFRTDSITANSAGEDIMFAASRWTPPVETGFVVISIEFRKAHGAAVGLAVRATSAPWAFGMCRGITTVAASEYAAAPSRETGRDARGRAIPDAR